MAVRRTKEEKQQAQIHRAQKLQYQYQADTTTKTKSVKADLFAYDTALIKKDLTRTVIAVTVVIMILVALYFQL
jgi:hypothetical protein